MPAYQYSALSPEGKTQRGVIEADSDKQLRTKLREQGLTPLQVTLITSNKKTLGTSLYRRKRISINDLALLTQQLATLLAAGLPVTESLKGVAEQSEKSLIKSILMSVRSRVLEGHSLANALSNFPQAFSELYCATIAAAEQTGHLDVVLKRLAEYLERQQHIRHKVQQALVYPSLMSFVAIGIVGFLLAYVVPRIISVFSNTGQALPNTTLLLLAISHFIGHFGLATLLILALLLYGGQRLLKKEEYRRRWHFFLLKIPLIGYNIRTLSTARFARTFGILFAAGVPILDAMRASAKLITNLPIREAITDATARVREGMALHRALKQTNYFSAMTIHLIASGEASGRLEEMLERAANSQDQSVTRLIETGLTLFEPLIILFMGAIVLFIVLAILLPIFNLDQMTG
jgi:general secretion pathway protein F